ncbi:MAG TPA: VPLPA-CTERM sorting domain-containing protein [Gammaproteobacteria bacterium]|nr:VPLPA-CTERM sorting domain-containing protein [Gammaproteobacteria bacterium]
MKNVLRGAAAAAVASVALFASSAFAQTGPIPLPTDSVHGGSGLIVSIWDTTKDISMVSYLGVDYPAAQPGTLTSHDFGLLSGFGTTFSTSSTANLVYTVFATKGFGAATGTGFVTTGPLGGSLGTPPIPNNGNVTAAISAANSFIGSVNNSCGATVPCVSDATQAVPLNTAAFAGQESWGDTYNGALSQASASSAVGTALGFFSVVKSGTLAGNPAVVTVFGNETTGFGQWLLTAGGNLSYSIAASSPVPLPAALWLLMSGCAGLATIGRRRKAALTA